MARKADPFPEVAVDPSAERSSGAIQTLPTIEEWEVRTVSEVSEILDHLRVPVNSDERSRRPGVVPYYGANGQQGWIDRHLFDEPLILLAEDGGNFDDYAHRPIAYAISGPSWVNNHAHILRARPEMNQKFLFHALEHRDIRRYISGGTRTKLTQAELRAVQIPVPPSREQRSIAEILDTLDEAIGSTAQLIEKLELIKRGLLHDLLTRGVNGNGGLRDPDLLQEQVSPIGKCPEEWGFVRLQDVAAHITKGSTPTTFGFSWSDSEGILFLRSECVRDGSFSLEGSERIPVAAHEAMQRSRIYPGDLLMTITGYVGRSCIYPLSMPEGNINQHIARIRVNRESGVHPGFVMWALQDPRQRARLERDLTGLAYPQISLAQVQAIPLPVPAMAEQEAIARILDQHQSVIGAESALLRKLRLLKTGLMEDLLTGRVRVTRLLEGDAA
jgi:type I restriction enzyme, S subunit